MNQQLKYIWVCSKENVFPTKMLFESGRQEINTRSELLFEHFLFNLILISEYLLNKKKFFNDSFYLII